MRFAALTMASSRFRNSSLGPQLVGGCELRIFSKMIRFLIASAPIVDETEEQGNTLSSSQRQKQESFPIKSHSTLGFMKGFDLCCRSDFLKEVIDLLVLLKSVKYFSKSITEITMWECKEEALMSLQDQATPAPVLYHEKHFYSSIAPYL